MSASRKYTVYVWGLGTDRNNDVYVYWIFLRLLMNYFKFLLFLKSSANSVGNDNNKKNSKRISIKVYKPVRSLFFAAKRPTPPGSMFSLLSFGLLSGKIGLCLVCVFLFVSNMCEALLSRQVSVVYIPSRSALPVDRYPSRRSSSLQR